MRWEGTEPKIWTNGGNQRADFYHRMRFVAKWFSDKSALNTDESPETKWSRDLYLGGWTIAPGMLGPSPLHPRDGGGGGRFCQGPRDWPFLGKKKLRWIFHQRGGN